MSLVSKQDMLRISGNGSSDGQVASDFALGALQAAKSRATEIEKVANLEVILDRESLRMIQSNLAGIRHIAMVVNELANLHANGQLGQAMKKLDSQVANLLAQAEQQVAALSALFP